MQTKRRPDEDDEGAGGQGCAVRPDVSAALRAPPLADADAESVRRIAKKGGGAAFVYAPDVSASQLRALRIEGLIEITAIGGRDYVRLTSHALHRLVATPGAALSAGRAP